MTWTFEDQIRAMAEAVPATKRTPHELLVNAAAMMTTPSDYVKFMLLMMERQPAATWKISEASRSAMLSAK